MARTWSAQTREPKKWVNTPRPWSAKMAALLGSLRPQGEAQSRDC